MSKMNRDHPEITGGIGMGYNINILDMGANLNVDSK